jgi:ferredoxin-NADP reductase
MYNKYQYIVNSANHLNAEIMLVTLAPKFGLAFQFKPGQYLTIATTTRGLSLAERPFSIVSSPTENRYVQIAFKIFGDYTSKLATLKAGDEVVVGGPYGEFIFNEMKQKKIALIAGGIGITPFMSMIKYIQTKGLDTRVKLLYGGRKIENTAFINDIVQITNNLPTIQAYFHFSDESKLKVTEIYKNNRIKDADLIKYFSDKLDTKFFVCGPPAFTQFVLSSLEKLGVPRKNIITEEFAISPPTFWPRNNSYLGISSAIAVTTLLLSLFFIYQSANQAKAVSNSDYVQPGMATPSATSSVSTSSSISTPTFTSTSISTIAPTTTYTSPPPQPRSRAS